MRLDIVDITQFSSQQHTVSNKIHIFWNILNLNFSGTHRLNEKIFLSELNNTENSMIVDVISVCAS